MVIPKVKEIIMKISSDIRAENIFIAKRFDSRIQAFKNLIAIAKVLKDLRSLQFRDILDKNPHFTREFV